MWEKVFLTRNLANNNSNICKGEKIMSTKDEKTKILFTMPVELKEELSKEAEKDYRSLNNYILWVLLNRNK